MAARPGPAIPPVSSLERRLSSRPLQLALLLGIGLVAAALYGSTLNDFFLADDLDLLWRASREPLGSWLVWPDPSRSTWFRPLPEALWRLNYITGGLDPFAYRLTNLLLHVLNALLVAAIARLAYGSVLVWPVAGLAFAAFPRATGAVSWICGRYDVLAVTFVLLTVFVGIRTATATRAGAWLLPIVLLGLAAVMSKEVAYVLPALCGALAWRPLSRRSGLTAPLLPWRVAITAALIVGAMLALRLAVFGGMGGYGVHGQVSATTPLRPLQLLPAFLPSTGVVVDPTGWTWLALTMVLLGLLAWRAPVWLAWTLLAVVPFANLVDLRVPFFEYDRFFYLASVGWALGLAALCRPQPRRTWQQAVAVACVAVLLAGSAFATRQRNRYWAVASDVAWNVQRTLVAQGPSLPADSAIDCSALPDNIGGAYAYRNGCDAHVRLAIPGDRVRGIRIIPGFAPDPVSARRAEFAHEYRLSPDGRTLSRVR